MVSDTLSLSPSSLNLPLCDLYTASECKNEGLYIPRYLLHSVKVLHLQMSQTLFRLSFLVRYNAYGLITFTDADSNSDPNSHSFPVVGNGDWNLSLTWHSVKSSVLYNVAIWFAVRIGISVQIRQYK